MKTVLIGVGQAGGKVTAALREFDREMGFDAIRGTLAVNSAQPTSSPSHWTPCWSDRIE